MIIRFSSILSSFVFFWFVWGFFLWLLEVKEWTFLLFLDDCVDESISALLFWCIWIVFCNSAFWQWSQTNSGSNHRALNRTYIEQQWATDIMQKKMHQSKLLTSKPCILNQYDLTQGSVKMPDKILLPESVLFLLQANNDRIIWPKSALVFVLKPVGEWFSVGPHTRFTGCSLRRKHETQHCIITAYIITFMLWGADHWLCPASIHSVHISSET